MGLEPGGLSGVYRSNGSHSLSQKLSKVCHLEVKARALLPNLTVLCGPSVVTTVALSQSVPVSSVENGIL